MHEATPKAVRHFEHRGYIIFRDDDEETGVELASVDHDIDEREAFATLWAWPDAWMKPCLSASDDCKDPDAEAHVRYIQELQDHVRVCQGLASPRSTQGVHHVKRPMYGRECDPNFLDYFVSVHHTDHVTISP